MQLNRKQKQQSLQRVSDINRTCRKADRERLRQMRNGGIVMPRRQTPEEFANELYEQTGRDLSGL